MAFQFSSFVEPKVPGAVAQDAVSVREISPNELLVAVADGVGGRPAGEIASRIAIQEFSSYDSNLGGDLAALFPSIVRQITREEALHSAFAGMATTLTVARLRPRSMEIWHVGDGVVFHLRDRGILRRTKPQTEAQDLVDMGILNRTYARRYHRRNVLTSVLSGESSFSIFRAQEEIAVGDRIVVATDGLENAATPTDLRNISLESPTVEEFLRRVSEEIRLRGPRDDYSAVAVDVR